VRLSNPGGGDIFLTHPDWTLGRPSFLYNGYRVFRGDKAVPSSAEGKERVELDNYSAHFCQRLSRPHSMKNSNNTIGNRTRDLPACSAVPQPTGPPRAPFPPFSIIPPVLQTNSVICHQRHASFPIDAENMRSLANSQW
jgi:hypothetical protein